MAPDAAPAAEDAPAPPPAAPAAEELPASHQDASADVKEVGQRKSRLCCCVWVSTAISI